MATWNLGSITEAVHSLVPNIPTALSGTQLLALADRKRQFTEDYTGVTIGSNSIDIKYQDVIVQLTAAQTAKSMLLIGVDASNIRLGDFSISNGAGGNLDVMAKGFEEMGMEQLKLLGRKITFKKAYG